MPAQRAPLPDGRWHFQHGPIDLVIGAEGDALAVRAAHAAAWARFEPLLAELVGELPELRAEVAEHCPLRGRLQGPLPGLNRAPIHGGCPCPLRGPVAQRMWRACWPHRHGFITPMAAVAGAVAEELIGCYATDGIARAWVNNGGDIALHLAPGRSVRVGLVADLARFDPARGAPTLDAGFEVHADTPVRGIATSGWRGRSFSFGIADSVTVLARSASMADAAATVIANAVNVDDPRIARRPANALKDDTDLGDRAVTVDVPRLEPALIDRALHAGRQRAEALRRAGLIDSALLVCQHRVARVARVEAARPRARRHELGCDDSREDNSENSRDISRENSRDFSCDISREPSGSPC